MSESKVFLIYVCIIGVVASIKAHGCSLSRYRQNPEVTLFLGKIPWAYIGTIGYFLIALATPYPVVQNLLVSATGLMTIFFIRKAYKLRAICVMCFLCWTVNVALVTAVLLRLIKIIP